MIHSPMIKIIIELVIALIPTVYGGRLLIKENKMSKQMTEDERVEAYPMLKKMKSSGAIFFFAGAYLVYTFYKNNFA